MKHLAAWLAIVPCLIVQGLPVDEDRASSFPLQNDTLHVSPSRDSSLHQASRRAGPHIDGVRLLDRTSFGLMKFSVPGNSEGEYQLHSLGCTTQSTATKFSSVGVWIEFSNGPDICDTYQLIPLGDPKLESWWKISGGDVATISWGTAKADVMSSTPEAALASARSEATDLIKRVNYFYARQYLTTQPMDVEWSPNLTGSWLVEAAVFGTNGLAYTASTAVRDEDHSPIVSPDKKGLAIAMLILVRAMVELISRRLYEFTPAAAPTLMDVLYIKLALRTAREMYADSLWKSGNSGVTTPRIVTHDAVSTALEFLGRGAMRSYDLGRALGGQGWISARDYKGVLANLVPDTCTREQGTISTS